MKILSGVIICILVMAVSMASVGNTADVCMSECHCSGIQMVCDGIIPISAPGYIREIIISHMPLSKFYAGVFCDVLWKNVSTLSINYYGLENGTETNETTYLNSDAFSCLNQIETMRFNISWLYGFRMSRISGLDNVRELDFHGCYRLDTQLFAAVMSLGTNFPKLSRLILSGVGFLQEGIYMSQDLVDAISWRNITDIDMSNTKISIPSKTELYSFCKTIIKLNVSYSTFNSDTHFRPCISLKILDASYVTLPRLIPLENDLYISNSHIYLRKIPTGLHDIETLYLNQIHVTEFDGIKLYIDNCSLTVGWGLHRVLDWTNVHVSGYNVPLLDIELIPPPNRLKYINLSNNKIEVIGAKLFRHFPNLTVIDLSYNILRKTRHFDDTFSKLFRNNKQLEEIKISDSFLEGLPFKTFSTNKMLKHIDLSRNSLQQLTFSVTKLERLRSLDLSHNRIEYLNKFSMSSLDSLQRKLPPPQNNNTNSVFAINLQENPFTCSCEALHFLQWFVESPLFAHTKHYYTCILEGETIPMNDEAIAVARDDCEKPIHRRRKILLLSLLPSLVFIFIALFITILLKRQRRRQYYRHLNERVNMLHLDIDEFRFPVFLSYSSDDSEFTRRHVLQPLQVSDSPFSTFIGYFQQNHRFRTVNIKTYSGWGLIVTKR